MFKQYRYAYYFSFYWKVHMKFLNLLYVCNYSKYFRTIVKSTYLLFSSHEVLNDQFIQERINCTKNPQLSIETGRWNEILINDRINIELTLPIANEFYFVFKMQGTSIFAWKEVFSFSISWIKCEKLLWNLRTVYFTKPVTVLHSQMKKYFTFLFSKNSCMFAPCLTYELQPMLNMFLSSFVN